MQQHCFHFVSAHKTRKSQPACIHKKRSRRACNGRAQVFLKFHLSSRPSTEAVYVVGWPLNQSKWKKDIVIKIMQYNKCLKIANRIVPFVNPIVTRKFSPYAPTNTGRYRSSFSCSQMPVMPVDEIGVCSMAIIFIVMFSTIWISIHVCSHVAHSANNIIVDADVSHSLCFGQARVRGEFATHPRSWYFNLLAVVALTPWRLRRIVGVIGRRSSSSCNSGVQLLLNIWMLAKNVNNRIYI